MNSGEQKKKIEINELPRENDSDVVNAAFRTALMKIGWTADQINDFYDKAIWGEPENNLDMCIVKIKELGFDESYFLKKYNQLWNGKRKKEQRQEASKEQSKILGRFNPMTIFDNVMEFHKHNPFYFDKNRIFWFWREKNFRWEMVDETDLINVLEEKLAMRGQIVTTNLQQKYIKAFESVGRELTPKEPPKHWIQFRNKIIDLKTKEEFEATSEYLFCNPLPWDISNEDETPNIDRIFKEWVGDSHIRLLFEIIAFCIIPEYFLHRIFCFVGSGSNGKGKFMELLRNFIGVENTVSTDLDTLLTSKFERAKLYKKLVCMMGETNFHELKRTALLKQLSGGDLIGGEFKNKTPFDFVNYSKLIIATNGLPITTDKSKGFYRRWGIVSFPNEFSEEKDVMNQIPIEEYNNLARKCVNILHELIIFRKFTNEGSIEERAKIYENTSNPLNKFIEDETEEDADGFIFKYDFKNRFLSWLKQNGYREWNDVEIGKPMKERFEEKRKETETKEKSYWCWIGLKWKIGEKNNSFNSFKGILLSRIQPVASRYVVETLETLAENRPLFINKDQKTPFLVKNHLNFIEIAVEVTEQDFVNYCISQGGDIQQVEIELKKLKIAGIIFEPRPGFLRVLT